jgi:hypothetical protein
VFERIFNFLLSLEKGRPLSTVERASYQPYFQPCTIDLARIVEGRTPFWLSKYMCVVVLGANIYFRNGAYLAQSLRIPV